MSKPEKAGHGGPGSASRERSRRRAERAARRAPAQAARRPARRSAHRRRERSFLDMLLISATIVIVAFVAVVLWILLRGMF